MEPVDFKALRQQVPLVEVLEIIGYDFLLGTGNQRYGRCPLGCSPLARCCSFNLARNLWLCHECGSGGNQLDLFCRVYQLPLLEGARALQAIAQVDLPFREFCRALRNAFPGDRRARETEGGRQGGCDAEGPDLPRGPADADHGVS